MKRGILILLSLCALAAVAYFTAGKWAIRHETLTFYDASRNNRPVAVDVAVRRDKEMQANAGMITLPVAILNHGNAIKFTEYSFLANVFAARGYIAISIQHDLPTDPPMVTKAGELYAGREPQYLRGVANIRFAVAEMQKVQPNADYDHLTVVGHSAGADISMYFAKLHPELVKKVVTFDNLRVPFITDGRFRILSFRSKDRVFKIDPAALPAEETAEKAGITVVRTEFQHNDMRDTGPDTAKESIQGMLDKFLEDDPSSELRPVDPGKLTASDSTKVEPSSKANDNTSGSGSDAKAADATCRDRLKRLGVVVNGPCIEVGEIVDNLASGHFSYNNPGSAYIGESFDLRLVLATSEKQDVRPSFEGIPGTVIKKEGQFGQSIEATLRGNDLKIEPAGPQLRTATTSKSVEWDWTVTPQSEGKKTLTIEVAVNILVGSDKQRVQLTTLHDEIDIQVSMAQRIKSYLAEAQVYLLAVGGVSAALLTVFGLVPKARKLLAGMWGGGRRKRAPGRVAKQAKPAKQG
jgi:pimeloyl-ACP methyl ester carboxylesterase